MAKNEKSKKPLPKVQKVLVPSELRYDLVSEDWVVIATGRAKRPEAFKRDTKQLPAAPKAVCPFEKIETQEYPTLAYYKGEKIAEFPDDISVLRWTTVAFPNKFPAFAPGISMRGRSIGPYRVTDGVGFHEVITTKDHTKDIPDFTQRQVKELIDVYQERYLALMGQAFVRYISIFKNKGPSAGATVGHPHSQLIAVPVTDPEIQRSLDSSYKFFSIERKCVHCVMLAWDRQEKSRVVYENDCFTVVTPFASRVAFEMRIYPIEHLAYFEREGEHQKECFADALHIALRKLSKALKDPDYNYYLHTAPADKRDYDQYHWHLEILPKTATWAGFELGTGIEISTIEPEKAAEFLRNQKV
ncbi:MAG: DUF4931 domain-containing protein [Candidatus Wildermuthbacteria bacterium]|nr:DUF4931 domain-containing protein [Candidatus Wildermuthbacteria bacterium]